MEVLKINFVGYYDYDPIAKLKQYYCDEGVIATDTQCHICKENILNYSTNISSNINKLFYKEAIVLGTCGHMFHKNCMFEWSKRNDTCPIDNVYWQYDRDLDTMSNLFFKNDHDCEMKQFNSSNYDLEVLKRKKNIDKTKNIESIESNVDETQKIIQNNKYDESIDLNDKELEFDEYLNEYGTKKYKTKINENLNFRNDLSIYDFLNTKQKHKKYQKIYNNSIITSDDNNKYDIIDDFDENKDNNFEEDEIIELLSFEDNVIISDDEDDEDEDDKNDEDDKIELLSFVNNVITSDDED